MPVSVATLATSFSEVALLFMMALVAQGLICQVHRGQSMLEVGLQTQISFLAVLCSMLSLFLC